MYGTHHPLHVLAARAAVASGWPRLRVLGPDEVAIQAARSAVVERLGPVPQADIIEPWSDGSDEPWELRVDLPGLSLESWAELETDLAAVGGVDVEWSPGAPRGVTEADDRGLRLTEWLDGGGLAARLLVDAEEGGPLSLDLARPGRVDAAVVELEQELATALRSVSARLVLRSDRGPDTLAPLVHRTSGRFGVELGLGPEAFEGLDGDAVLALRSAVLDAVAGVVLRRAQHPTLQLAPDVRWDVPLGGLSLLLWVVAPPVPALPGDAVVPIDSPDTLLEELCRDVPALVRDLEVQVVPTSPAAHDDVAAAGVPVAAEGGWVGGAPRWVRTEEGWSFVPTWRVTDPSAPALSRSVRQLRARGDVAAVRVVPGEPSGLEASWPTVDPTWWIGERRCWMRCRDGVRDRDHLERVDDRAAQDSDRELEVVWRAGLSEPATLGEVRPIVDRLGRPGLEAQPGAAALTTDGLLPLLAASDALDEPHLASVGTLGFPADGPRLRLWWRVPVPDRPRIWRGQAPPRQLSDDL